MSETNNNHDAHSHGSYKEYFIGFVLSILLTIVPYNLVVSKVISASFTLVTVMVVAVLQLLVQVIFFLHLGSESKPKWNQLAFLFTLFVVFILVGGSMWIMYNLNYNMMDH